jgi:hypothetical protein
MQKLKLNNMMKQKLKGNNIEKTWNVHINWNWMSLDKKQHNTFPNFPSIVNLNKNQ